MCPVLHLQRLLRRRHAVRTEQPNPQSLSLFWRFGVLAVSPSLPPSLSIVRDAEGWVFCDVLIDHQQNSVSVAGRRSFD